MTLLLEPEEVLDTKEKDVDVHTMTLQDVFVALCGKEETHE